MSDNWAKERYAKCAWCGKQYKYLLGERFCSERCKIAYDRAHGTVDGGYREGSFGHKINNFFKVIEIIIAVIIILGLVISVIKKAI